MVHGKAKSCRGGHKIKAMKAKTAKEWCEFYGVKVIRGCAILFKALDSNFNSPHGANYSPGSKPVADDWDGGDRECGGGLHFSPHPAMAKSFNMSAEKYAACPVKLDDIVVHPNGSSPEKVKAEKVSRPCYEVDIHGNRL